MKILLYNPDNGVTRNFMPHLWMFLLQALTPPGHEVTLIDGNARAMNEEELVRYVRERGIECAEFAVADTDLVDDLRRHRDVPAPLVLPYVRLRCTLNRFHQSAVVQLLDDADLTQRARAEVALHTAA